MNEVVKAVAFVALYLKQTAAHLSKLESHTERLESQLCDIDQTLSDLNSVSEDSYWQDVQVDLYSSLFLSYQEIYSVEEAIHKALSDSKAATEAIRLSFKDQMLPPE